MNLTIMKSLFVENSIFIIGIFIAILIRGFFILNGTDTADITKLREMGEAILKGDNPYLSIPYNVYPPLALYLEAATKIMSNFFNIPFHILTKIWPNLADIAIAVLIYKFLRKFEVKSTSAHLWSLIFILNPISIIISSVHGQIDSITSLFVLFSIYLLIFYFSKFYLLAAICLGLAIAIKPNPIMLIPLFLFVKTSFLKNFNLNEKFIFSGISLAPVLVLLAFFKEGDNAKILESLVGYSGVYDFGYAAIIRGILYQDNANIWIPTSDYLLNISKIIFLLGSAFVILIFANSKNLIKACLSMYLLFLTVYFGISAQYLSWVLPLAVVAREKMIIIFSATGLFALLGFYMFFGPEILLGKFSNINEYQSKYMSIYFFGNLLFWFSTSWWLVKIIKDCIYFKKKQSINYIKSLLLISFHR